MLELLLFNIFLIILTVIIQIISKKTLRSERAQNIALLVSSLLTVVCHYSSLLYHLILDGTAMDFLRSNPNLLVPIYPCNVVMWVCVIFGLMKNKNSKMADCLIDYMFWFGIISCLVGMLANVDFIRNPNFSDYDNVKSVVAHAFMLNNILLLSTFKRVKISLPKNIINIAISIFAMFFIGIYCNILFTAIASEEQAYIVNSMFILHSPFDGVPALRYPLIGIVSLVFYFILFNILELIKYKKGNRWYSRIKNKFHSGSK